MPNEIDLLMDMDPLMLSKDPQALDTLIAHYRNTRAKEGTDGRMKKGKSTPSSGPKLGDILKGMNVAPKPTTGGVRRI